MSPIRWPKISYRIFDLHGQACPSEVLWWRIYSLLNMKCSAFEISMTFAWKTLQCSSNLYESLLFRVISIFLLGYGVRFMVSRTVTTGRNNKTKNSIKKIIRNHIIILWTGFLKGNCILTSLMVFCRMCGDKIFSRMCEHKKNFLFPL